MSPEDATAVDTVCVEAHRMADLVERQDVSVDHRRFINLFATVYNAATRSRINDTDQFSAQDELYATYTRLCVELVRRNPIDRTQGPDAVYRALITKWRHFKVIQRWMLKTFGYLSRFYISHRGQPSLESVALNAFYHHVFVEASAEASDVLLSLVRHERQGDEVEKDSMRQGVEMFGRMATGEGAVVYRSQFVEPFLKATEEFYQRESGAFIADNPATTYLERAARWLDDEAHRAAWMLPAPFAAAVTSVVEQQVLVAHLQNLLHMRESGWEAMLRDERVGHIKLMYGVMSRLQQAGLEPMAALLNAHCRGEGELIARKHSVAEDEINFKGYVTDFIALHEKYLSMLSNQLDANATFQAAVSSAFEVTLNAGLSVALKDGETLNVPCSELMSNYCDSILKAATGDIDESEVEGVFTRVVALFCRVTEKDLFQEYLRKHLSRRLLAAPAFHEDLERILIMKLKATCGAPFTSKLEGMINDRRQSQDISKEFTEQMRVDSQSLSMDFSCHVLTTGFWPAFKQETCVVPAAIQPAIEAFEAFYAAQKKTRVLKWVGNHGTAVLTGFFERGNKELTMNHHQAAILLLFNERPVWELGELQTRGGLDRDDVRRVTQSLGHQRLKLLLLPEGQLTEHSAVHLNDAFSSTHKKLRMPVAVQRVAPAQTTRTVASVEADRKPAIDACIVSIMKSRRQLEHNLLVAEVIERLASRFRPEPRLIKQRIEDLINREYIERHPSGPNVYVYVA